MLRFFRQIRHRFLLNNRVGQYLVYAIGEIVLIVVGIMIALQLDNYNDQRKQEAEMRQNLVELLSEMESNVSRSYGTLRFYSNRDSLIRQHLCNTISRDDIKSMRDLRIQWNLITSNYVSPYDRVVLDKVLSDIENMPAELEYLKGTLRDIDGLYEEMQGNYDVYRELSQGEMKYRADHNSWHRALWRWDRPFDEDLRNQVLDYLFDDPHYQNQLYEYWNWVTEAIVLDMLTIRDVSVFCMETIPRYLNPSQDDSYQLPEPIRFDLTEVVGTYRNYRKFLNEGERNLELGDFVLFEQDGRLFSYTRYDGEQDKTYQSDQTAEWLVLDPKTVISPAGWFMHLVESDSGPTTLEYAGCNHRNLYFDKMD